MSEITKPGIYPDIATAIYHGDPCPAASLTQSIAKVLNERSPRHAMVQHPRLCPPPTEDEAVEKYVAARVIGDAAHLMMIGRGKDLEVAQFDSWRKDDAKKIRDAAERAGRTPILQKHFEKARAMVYAARAQLAEGGFETAFRADTGMGECCIAWQEGDLWFRSLIDFLQNDHLVVWDFKTTERSVAPHAVSSLMLNAGWDIQAAMIERGLDVLFPETAGRRKFRFVAQEQEDPHALTVCELPESTLTMGRKKLARAASIWRECMERGEWPAYPPGIVYPVYPGWAETQWLNREIEEAEAPPQNLLLAG